MNEILKTRFFSKAPVFWSMGKQGNFEHNGLNAGLYPGLFY